MTSRDPTSGRGWSDASTADDRLVDDPLTREAAPRGVEPWQLTPGAPPVRKVRPPRARSLLRDSTIHRAILHKSRTPVPAPAARRREAETARKPEGHERDFYKPPAPLLTNVVVDRPPPVRKQGDPTWDPAPERVARPAEPVEPLDAITEEIENAWFLTADGTLEPAEERVVLPPRRIAVFLAAGAAIGALALVAVAIGRGTGGSEAEAVVPSVQFIVGEPLEEWPAPFDAPVVDEAGTVEAATEEGVAPPPAPVPRRAKKGHGKGGMEAIDRLRASMAENTVVAPETPAPSAPAKTPEGSAELWGEIEKTDAAEPIWGEIK